MNAVTQSFIDGLYKELSLPKSDSGQADKDVLDSMIQCICCYLDNNEPGEPVYDRWQRILTERNLTFSWNEAGSYVILPMNWEEQTTIANISNLINKLSGDEVIDLIGELAMTYPDVIVDQAGKMKKAFEEDNVELGEEPNDLELAISSGIDWAAHPEYTLMNNPYPHLYKKDGTENVIANPLHMAWQASFQYTRENTKK